MKKVHLLLLALLIVSAISIPVIYIHYFDEGDSLEHEVFFGVTLSLNTTREAKLLIDKVKYHTNLLAITAWDFCARNDNGSSLNEICEYVVNAKLHFIVFFSFISHVAYPWHIEWLNTAKERFGEYFLGVYFYDEPGGNQIDKGVWRGGSSMANVSNYSEAASWYVENISSSPSMLDLKIRDIPVFTSDYALYWFDYLAGYDCVFVEFGWNHSRTQHIALGRGAANAQGKKWGVIITWTYRHPPFLENGNRLFDDLVTAYKAGAEYIIIFNYPKMDEYGVLTEEHFNVIKEFWNLLQNSPKTLGEKVTGQVAYVLPRDYGWGMRSPEDNIWGIWPPDDLSQTIWSTMNKLIERYSLKLDIIYDDPRFNVERKYAKIYSWNSTID